MKTFCYLTILVGLIHFVFGEFCLIAPSVGYSSEFDNLGALSLDEIGVYSLLAGSVLWGASLIALACIPEAKKKD